MSVHLEESKDDHAVRVLEVLVERVQQLEERVNGDALTARPAAEEYLVHSDGI